MNVFTVQKPKPTNNQPPLDNIPPQFRDFFKNFPPGFPFGPQQQPSPQEEERPQALGSGFVISADGYIVTNNHVIEQANEIKVKFQDETELEAKLIGKDRLTDLALLKVESKKSLDFVKLADSDKARVGHSVIAIGNPFGLGGTVTSGIISARNRELSGAYDDYIQTDAAINRGNSGGPLFNMDGEVVGVNTAILSPNGGSIGIGFSMSSNVVAPVVDQLREFGEVRRGWLGVNIGNVTDDMAEALGLSDTSGAIVLDVFDGPALDAGLKSMDIIISFDGQDVGSSGELVRLVGKTAVGKTVNAIIIREGSEQTLSITLGQRPDPDALAQRQEIVPKKEESKTIL